MDCMGYKRAHIFVDDEGDITVEAIHGNGGKMVALCYTLDDAIWMARWALGLEGEDNG